MPHPSTACCPAGTRPDPRPGRFEPALAQIRQLPAADLDALVRRWLAALGCRGTCRRTPPEEPATYSAMLGDPGAAFPVQARVYRRRNRLQAHHVEAFAGHL